MTPEERHQRKLARRARQASLVMALAMLYWISAQFLGSRLGWNPYLSFAFDLAAIAALVWALFITYQVYKARRDGPPPGGSNDRR